MTEPDERERVSMSAAQKDSRGFHRLGLPTIALLLAVTVGAGIIALLALRWRRTSLTASEFVMFSR